MIPIKNDKEINTELLGAFPTVESLQEVIEYIRGDPLNGNDDEAAIQELQRFIEAMKELGEPTEEIKNDPIAREQYSEKLRKILKKTSKNKRVKNTLRPYISNLTAKRYSAMFTGADGTIQLCCIDKEHIESLMVKKNGIVVNRYGGITNFSSILKPIEATNVDLPLMQAVYSVMLQSLDDGKAVLDGNTLKIRAKDLAGYMGIKYDKAHHADFVLRLLLLNDVYGRYENGNVRKFLTLTADISGMLHLDVNLLRSMIDDIQRENVTIIKEKRKKEHTVYLPIHSELVHSNIPRKNKNAYFIVTQIEALLVQAGKEAGQKKYGVHKKFSKLIDCIPSLQCVIENDNMSRQYKNEYLKRAFSRAYELMKTHTDFYEKYRDLNIPEIIPTQDNLNDVLEITHNGINEDYRPRK